MFEIKDPVLVFSVLMLIFLFAPLIAEKLKLPELVLLLIAGVIVGPNGVGLMEREGGIELFGSIGLIYIMFVAGLETETHNFKLMAKKSAIFGTISFMLPQILGAIISHYTLGFNWSASILLASMFASHTLIAYPIASRLGIVKSEPVVVAVGGTIITNTLALLVLAVIADHSKGASLGVMFWGQIVFGMFILTTGIWWLLPIVASKFFRGVPEKGGAQFVFVLCMVCLCSYWSHYAKMEPIIGAFLAGVAFNRLIPAQSTLMNRLVFVGNTFFIPFFLISVGMLINPKALFSSWDGALVAIVMSVTVVLTKYWSAIITGRLFNYNKAENKVIFGLSVAQAAATLAAVLVGYDLGIFKEDVLNGTIVMILVTCSLGCYFVERYGRNVSTKQVKSSSKDMGRQRIMVAVSNPHTASRLMDLSFMLWNQSTQDKILPVTIVNDMNNGASNDEVSTGERVLGECLSQAASVEIPLQPGLRIDTNPSDGLIRASRENRCSLLVIGWSGKTTLRTRIFGTISEKLLEGCPARLLFSRLRTPINTCKRVVLPMPELFEHRPDLNMMISDCKQLASQCGATLHIILPNASLDMEKSINKISPPCSVTFKRIAEWGRHEKEFINSINPNDTIILPLERRESAFWRPRFERLADMVVERYSDINILAAYPQIPDHYDEIEDIEPQGASDTQETVTQSFDLNMPDIGSAITHISEQTFTAMPEMTLEVKEGLLESLRNHPLELSENALLLHCRSEQTQRCTIVVGFTPAPYSVVQLAGKYNVIVVLVSPKSSEQEIHLRELANIARLFMNPEFSTQIQQANCSAEILKLLK